MGDRNGCPDENLTHMLFPQIPALRPVCGIPAEKGHKVAEMASLTGQCAGGFGALVGKIGVALRHRVHIGDGPVDLLQADGLLTGGADNADGPGSATIVTAEAISSRARPAAVTRSTPLATWLPLS